VINQSNQTPTIGKGILNLQSLRDLMRSVNRGPEEDSKARSRKARRIKQGKSAYSLGTGSTVGEGMKQVGNKSRTGEFREEEGAGESSEEKEGLPKTKKTIDSWRKVGGQESENNCQMSLKRKTTSIQKDGNYSSCANNIKGGVTETE